jgi:ATP-dependent RNA helicase DHX33
MVRDVAFFGIKKEKKGKKPMPYVDVSDEDPTSKPKELKRKAPFVNGHHPHQVGSSTPKHKKRRYSLDEGGSQPDNSNDAGPSQSRPHVSGPEVSAKAKSIQEQRKNLPIATGLFSFFKFCELFTLDPGREALVEEIRKNNVTILLGETGSGKTTRKDTQFPILLFSHFHRGTSIYSREWTRKKWRHRCYPTSSSSCHLSRTSRRN